MGPLFGRWIRDVELAPPRRLLAHTLYWRRVRAPDAHIAALREALGLDVRPQLVTLQQRIPAYALRARGASPRRAPGPLAR